MVSILLTILVFWLWPARDLRRAQKVSGIGSAPGQRMDDAVVEGWKAGRIRCRKLWLNFGTAVVVGAMLDWVVTNFWGPAGATPDAKLATGFTVIEIAAIVIGLLGWVVSLILSARNNKKYLGQFRVTL